MDAISTYCFGNLSWLSLQALPLILWPGFISSLLRDEYSSASSLENYFARSLGFAILALGLVVVILSGSLPLTGNGATTEDRSTHSAYADATILVSTLYHASAAFYCYGRFHWTGQTAYTAGCLGSAVMASFGLWCIMFAGDKSRVNKRTGFDKNTSGFPFKNSESYRTKKKGI
ncbi:hypothetical protein SODALDRAFT_351723 [Sodiomyces alkalinus F11]|uniref:MARVEL domain-containing protein n=1 Tax=Sodiomyces alkalinus (strain CBS 110278 / VKM F-3762 / F11) TaxID=1314773 RepID=A0A3N2PSH6_SODAK|nr:hypothetical protein SODALDRAFT_351723 [Sodiomyces alkalinus F11]ROT37438.1 hypothetical protein SODALDRAFT_351723 [Sodiomyces alkalinus F11]